MGFKRIKHNELKTKSGFNLIGLPLSQTVQSRNLNDSKSTKETYSWSVEKASDISIANEEVLDFQYNYDRSRKSLHGYGNLSVSNNSTKDRIWDTRLEFSGSKQTSIGEANEVALGIFEPKTNKSVKYDFINTEEISDLIRIDEDIEILSDKIESIKNESEYSEEDVKPLSLKRNNILLSGRENLVKYTIVISNVSSSIIEEIELRKALFKDFYEFKVSDQTSKNLDIKRNSIEWSVNKLHPGENATLEFSIKVMPNKSQKIKTGIIETSFEVKDNVVSNVKVNRFTAFSHAFHAISKSEVNHKPNHWKCFLVFENHSEYLMELRTILITDKSKTEKYVNLNFETSNIKTLINSGESYQTDEWEIADEKEPSFFRKIEYSVNYNFEKSSTIKTYFADDVFEVVDYKIEKLIPRTEIKSFEESVISNKITIKNNSSIPIYAVVVKEVVPEDFLLPMENSAYALTIGSEKLNPDSYTINISPNNDDPSITHALELDVNLSQNNLTYALGKNDTLEINYPLRAMTPDNKKSYDFPLEVYAYFPKYHESGNKGIEEFHVIKEDLDRDAIPSLNISHKRRNIMIGKEIFPGRSNDEFAINIMIKNKSNASIKDIDISDTFPESFKLISSNMNHKMTKSSDNHNQTINFAIPNIAPYQEMEIMYYLKTLDGNDVNYTELESYFYG
jgi:hypothetical protein